MMNQGARRAIEASAEQGSEGSLKQRAYAELKQRILTGRLAPGTLLSERQLASELKMSKTPVHAALERLEADGLVTVAAQQGIMVRAISPQDVSDHYEIREAIEPFVVRKLAGRLTPGQIQRLEANLKTNRRAVRELDIAANVHLDSEFHFLLCEFLGNREIARVMVQLREKVLSVIHHLSSIIPNRMTASLAEHQAIAKALTSGNATAAADLMTQHLRNGLECIYQRNP